MVSFPSPRPRPRILIVDDDAEIRKLLTFALDGAGYACESCGGAEMAAARMEAGYFAAVITDFELTDGDGLGLIRAARARYPAAVFLMASGVNSARVAVDALRAGADDFLLKPLSPSAVIEAVTAALERGRERRESARARGALERLLALQTAAFDGVLERTLRAVAAALETRAADAGHARRVGNYARELARYLGYGDADLDRVEQGAQLHDIGTVGIAEAILTKPGPLTEVETRGMREHVRIGLELISHVPALQPAAAVILAHHERFDGAGYPHGLAGDAIPLDARVFSVADALDAMTSDRPYRRALGWEEASAVITHQSGRQFDPAVVAAFLAIPHPRWRALRD
jgi:response regulator RpfG family c-di-GMP phosphodiesterase